VETVGGPDNFTEEQWEVHAQNIAELARHDGGILDGVRVEFTIDREHVLGHRECGLSTECPGDAQVAYFDTLLERAQAILDGDTPPPEHGTLDPNLYPELHGLHVELSRAFGE
jgi:hypothetical protein